MGLRRFVDFLIDTGASVTILLDRDTERLRLNTNRLKRAERDVDGIGGLVDTYPMERVRLIFRAENGPPHEESRKLYVGRHDITRLPKAVRELVMAMPFLMGRDVVYRFKLYLNHAENELYLES